MEDKQDLYAEIISLKNLIFAEKKARKGKTKKNYVIKFEENLTYNLKLIHEELKNQTYFPRPLKTFVIRDPKTRTISKADFRDRIAHHALCNVIEPIFDRTFIYDNSANRKGKGSLFAINRFNFFKRKVTNNLSKQAFCFKADIKHYFREINREILLNILKRKIKDEQVMWLIKVILERERERERETQDLDNLKGMPLGNLTSQFFANVYLNELDQFVKHKLKIKYYIRYVDDFVLLHSSKEQLNKWKREIEKFLKENLKLELHRDKSKIISLSKGIDFVGFRNFYYYKLLRKRNIRSIQKKIEFFNQKKISEEKFNEIWQGWCAYANWANTHNLINKITP